jgi:hypothetical protein
MSRTHERVTIALWRGYVSGCFYARPPDADTALCLSPPFRTVRLPWERRNLLHEQPRAVDALRALEERLVAAGWQRRRRAPSSAWYELRFSRAPAGGAETRARPGEHRGRSAARPHRHAPSRAG